MKSVLLVGLGGAVGSMLRYGITLWLQKFTPHFPSGTLLVNLLGCLIIGILSGMVVRLHQSAQLTLMAGFCGGFTTFSTFVLDDYTFLKEGLWSPMLLYTLISWVGGLGLCVLGIWIGQKLA